MAPLDKIQASATVNSESTSDLSDHRVLFKSQFVQPAGAAQVGPQAAGAAQVGPQAAGAAQVGAQDDVPQVVAQHFGLQRRTLGKQSFGILILWQRGLQQLLQLEATGAQVEATGAQETAGAAQEGPAGAQAAAGAAQVGAQAEAAGPQAGAAQVGAAATHAAGAAQLGAELQLLQLLWWNRPA